ncbi:MAG: hypothetical protein IMZ66_04805, partial [Planctomycetes bacterium]|nr:hypothetical protein [Planctomycetota bacterium]
MADETPRTQPSPLAAADALAAAPPRRRRWLRVLIVLAAAGVALVLLAPTLLSLGIVRGYVLDQVNARLPVVVGVEDWSFSWFGSQRVYGVSAAMAGDPPFATAQELVLDEGLVGLVADRKRTGPVRVRGAEVWTDRTKRLRDELAGPPEAEKPPTEEPEGPLMPVVPASVEFDALTVHAGASGTIRLASALYTTGPEKDTLQAEAEFDYHPAPDAAGTGAPAASAPAPAPGAAAPAPDAAHGKVSVQAELEGLSADWQGAGRLGASGTVKCETLPLAALWAMATDFGLPLGGDGALSADATFARTRAGDVSVQARCNGSNLRVWGVPVAAAAPADGAAGKPAAKAPADLGPLQGDVVVLETLD